MQEKLEKKCSNNREKLGLQPKFVFTYLRFEQWKFRTIFETEYFFDFLLEASTNLLNIELETS